jgi:hypothetical protein
MLAKFTPANGMSLKQAACVLRTNRLSPSTIGFGLWPNHNGYPRHTANY